MISHCISNLLETGALVIGITFDGAPTNLSAVKILGCDMQDTSSENVFQLENCIQNSL